MFLARARTRTARSGVECTNHEAIAPSVGLEQPTIIIVFMKCNAIQIRSVLGMFRKDLFGDLTLPPLQQGKIMMAKLLCEIIVCT